jgi:DNA-binding protein H-NS
MRRLDFWRSEMAMPSTKDLLKATDEDLSALRAEIEKEFKRREGEKRQEVLGKMRELAASAGMSVRELVKLSGSPSSPRTDRLPPKFRHPEDSTLTWSGRGGVPSWMREWEETGKSRNDLRIAG